MNDERQNMENLDPDGSLSPDQQRGDNENGQTATLSLEDELTAAREEAAKNLDGWQRALADLSNARKRFDKQTQQAYTNATVEVVSKLLPIMDDFDRAIESVPANIAQDPWFEGLSGVMRKLNRILESIDAERIPAVDHPFDPNYHEALSMEPSPNHESGTVIRELQGGYRIGERVIRPALVVVAQ